MNNDNEGWSEILTQLAVALAASTALFILLGLIICITL